MYKRQVTRNEIVVGINSSESYFLVIVQIEPTGDSHNVRKPVYIKNPFEKEPDFEAASLNYKVADMLAKRIAFD